VTMARFANDEYTADGRMPAWMHFVREVGRVRGEPFGAPEIQASQMWLARNVSTPAPGYVTELYPGARVVLSPERSDEGVRVIADTEEMAAVFLVVAARMGIHIGGHDRSIVIGITASDREAGYVSFDDGYRPDAHQELHLITLESGVIATEAEVWAEAVFEATNNPGQLSAPAQKVRQAMDAAGIATRSVSVGDTVTVGGATYACERTGWVRLEADR